MDQTEEDSETWKIENLSTHNNYELKKQKEHSHDYFQIVWVKKGQGLYTINFKSKEIVDNSLLFNSARLPSLHRFVWRYRHCKYHFFYWFS